MNFIFLETIKTHMLLQTCWKMIEPWNDLIYVRLITTLTEKTISAKVQLFQEKFVFVEREMADETMEEHKTFRGLWKSLLYGKNNFVFLFFLKNKRRKKTSERGQLLAMKGYLLTYAWDVLFSKILLVSLMFIPLRAHIGMHTRNQ